MEIKRWQGIFKSLKLIPIYTGIFMIAACTSNRVIVDAELPTPIIDTLPAPTLSRSSLLSSCTPTLIQITDEPVRDLFWRAEDHNLYFLPEDQAEWKYYDVSSHTVFTSTNYSPSFEIDWNQIANNFSIKEDWFDISLSPSGNRLMYTKLAKSSVNSDQLVEPVLIQEIYLVVYGSQPVYFGRIYGQIDKIEWFPDETKVLLYMRYTSPYQISNAYMWIF